MKDKIIVFGRGWYYQNKSGWINNKYEIIGFLDNSVAVGKVDYEDGVPVHNPNDYDMLEAVDIVLAGGAFLNMCHQLVSLGVPENRILFGVNFDPAYDLGEKCLKERNGKVILHDGRIYIEYLGEKFCIENTSEYKKVIKKIIDNSYASVISMINALPLQPMSRRFGLERGKAIDRRYIEKFLEINKPYIKGDVMEIEDDTYTVQFGESRVKNSYVLHVDGYGGNAIKGDLQTGEGLEPNTIDCLICTQTIQMIYSVNDVVSNIYNLLRDNGTALVTAHCIGQLSMSDYRRWGEYWRFTPRAFSKLFSDKFGQDNVEVKFFGNVKTAAAFLYGLCVEDMEDDDFEYCDEQYSVIVAVRAKKR